MWDHSLFAAGLILGGSTAALLFFQLRLEGKQLLHHALILFPLLGELILFFLHLSHLLLPISSEEANDVGAVVNNKQKEGNEDANDVTWGGFHESEERKGRYRFILLHRRLPDGWGFERVGNSRGIQRRDGVEKGVHHRQD